MNNKLTPLVVANWKMNPTTITMAKKIYTAIAEKTEHLSRVDVVIAAPTPFLMTLEYISSNKLIATGAQDVFFEAKGTYTGEVSVSMLKSVGVSYVIVGHSERRALGETNELVSKKIQAVLKSNLVAILCVGEKERDTQGEYFNFIEAQLVSVLDDTPVTKLSKLVIAYEPIWAISSGDGKGRTATPEDAHEMKLFIQKIIADKFGRSAIKKVKIIYGGSVNKTNALSCLEEGKVDGFLVGGASLRALEFAEIIKIAATYAKA